MNTPADTISQINQEVLALWRKQYAHNHDNMRGPLLYPDLDSDGILFIGCNPSDPGKNHYKTPTLKKLQDKAEVDALIKKQDDALISYPYFNRFREIAASLEMPWCHIDWFFERDTKQNDLRERIQEKRPSDATRIHFNEFAKSQITLSKKLMEIARPRIVVVANAFASEIARVEFDLGSLDQQGLFWTTLANRRVPVFLSGMLSGQRALDRGSRERLEWHLIEAKKLLERGIK